MNKKIFSTIFILAGVLVLTGAGCGNQNLTGVQQQANVNLPAGNQEAADKIDSIATESPNKFYNSVEEIVAPTGLPSELKSLLSEACGEVKLTTLTYNLAGTNTDLLVYTWKNKPTEEKLMSLFKKDGYEVEMLVVGIFTATKDRSSLTVDWNSPDREDLHEIVVSAATEK